MAKGRHKAAPDPLDEESSVLQLPFARGEQIQKSRLWDLRELCYQIEFSLFGGHSRLLDVVSRVPAGNQT